MRERRSFIEYGNLGLGEEEFSLRMPSAIISDGLLTIPLYGVTSMSLNQAFHLPPIGSSGHRAAVDSHDDSISLTGVLVGPLRYIAKESLEMLAEVSRRGSAISAFTGGKINGLFLVTTLTLRSDMQIQSLSFSVSASRLDTIDVSISLIHVPLPSKLGALLDIAEGLFGTALDPT